MNTAKKVLIFIIFFSFSGFAVSKDGIAKQRVVGQYTTSKYPYWKVGTLNKQLSIACRDGGFKQQRYLLYSIGYLGKQGRGITGIAKKGWNLYDPFKLAKPGFTYHFFNQGYSNCKVFMAKTPR